MSNSAGLTKSKRKQPKAVPDLAESLRQAIEAHMAGLKSAGPAVEASKELIRELHSQQRNERLRAQSDFVARAKPSLEQYFADGCEIEPGQISVSIEEVKSGTWQSDLFRLASLTWSVPVSNGYGRRMRFLVWDAAHDRLMGLIALGDPVFNLRVRDEYIGWTIERRGEALVNMMDAYVLGAVQPYSSLLGGKLLSSLICTRDVARAFEKRYYKAAGIITGREKKPRLAAVTTTSALGRSSVYNRLTLDNRRIFKPIGFTSGWGHFHIPDGLFSAMRMYLELHGDDYAANYKYGQGPNWKLRAARKALSSLGLRPNLLCHGVQRQVFICELAANAKAFLTGKHKYARMAWLPTAEEVADKALSRWLVPRSERDNSYRAWEKDAIFEELSRIAGDETRP